MPPSPAMRCSPGRELRVDNHKRGRSLEGGRHFREKDDDLALFNEVQSRERDNFLLQSNDDFEDTFSTKLRYFSEYKLGISIPVRGESSDLLNAEGEKNDYDWLLTPPDTPLFPSLDDETPPVNLVQRGRPRSQPISFSRSSTMEKSYRSSRGSASPNRLSPSPQSGNSTLQSRGRQSSATHSSPVPSLCHATPSRRSSPSPSPNHLSPSPRSGNSTLQSRGRPSSATRSSPTPSLHHATPSRRPSPPPSKPSTPASRSSTPTPRRMSTGSNGTVASSRVQGASPVKTSRGNSASPKLRAWQSNIPGFSLEVPPNLRTSLGDRPASYVRGSSPASRNGRDSSSKSGRQSMSPTASRSVSSSYSHDRVSTHSKGSVASSGDDDVDSLQCTPVSSSAHSASRSAGSLSNNRGLAFSKKPTRIVSSSSAPKRSFDLALRQMDHRKAPQNMFRPLLSSVPSSTFYVGKASAAHRAMISRNSSVTTSSNASSGQATSGALDTEGSEQNQEDVTSEFVKVPHTDVQDEVFAFDKADALNEDVGHGIYDGLPSSHHGNINGGSAVDSQLGGSENFSDHGISMAIPATSGDLDVKRDFSNDDGFKDIVLCSKCGSKYHATKSIEGELKLCPDCTASHLPLTSTTLVTAVTVAANSPSVSMKISENYESVDALKPPMAVPESLEMTTMNVPLAGQHERILKEDHNPYSEPSWNSLSANSLAQPLVEDGARKLANQQVIGQPSAGYGVSDGDMGGQQLQSLDDHQNLEEDVSEGAGISVLLKRSTSGKGPIVQSRICTPTSIPYDDLSYVRDSINSMRSSFGHGSASASSSVDLGSASQTEPRVQRQRSGRKSDRENYRYEMNTKHQHTESSLSGTSNHAFQALGLATSTHGCFEAPQEQLLASENTELDDSCTDVESNYNCRTMDASTIELSSHTPSIHLADNSITSFSNFDETTSHEIGEDLTNHTRNISDIEPSAITLESSTIEEDAIPSSCMNGMRVAEVPTQGFLDTISEIEIVNGHVGSPGSQSGVVSPNSKDSIDELREPSVPTASDGDLTVSFAESDFSDHTHSNLEESTVTVGGEGRTTTRSLSLEEATDTILFCSSIIHNLAYEAATIAMEKEKEKENSIPIEGSRPTVTILGKSNFDRKDPLGRTLDKRTSKPQKARQRRVETDTKHPPSDNESDEKKDFSTARIVGVPNKNENMKPPKLESKCNCSIM